MYHGDMLRTPYISLSVDLYSWVGEEEGHDGCIAIICRQMQRGPATLQRQRNRRRGEVFKEIKQGRGWGQGRQDEEWGLRWRLRDAKQPPYSKLSGGDSDSKKHNLILSQ